MSTIYGGKLASSPVNGINFDGGQVIGKNSEVFTANDPVTIDASNGLKVAGTTDPIYGFVQKTQTMTGSNQTVAKVKPVVLVPDLDYEFLMGCNAVLTPLTSVGAFYKLTAATTATVQVDVTSGVQTTTNRVVECTSVDPFGTGDYYTGRFRIVKRYNLMNY
jgi:hypothetical protein